MARIPDLWPREKRLGPRRGALPWLAIQAGDRRRKGSGGRTLPLGYHAAPWGRQRGEMAGIGAECRPGPRLALPIDLLLAVALAGGGPQQIAERTVSPPPEVIAKLPAIDPLS